MCLLDACSFQLSFAEMRVIAVVYAIRCVHPIPIHMFDAKLARLAVSV
jgi:alkylhydroperoxidase/carboxymuconolactone decarboxylase family protein YurZ